MNENVDRNAPVPPRGTVSLFGVNVQVPRPYPGLFRSGAGPRDRSVRVYSIRVLTRGGVRARFSFVQSVRCSRMLNRALGLIFRPETFDLPREISALFRVGKFRN